MNRRIIPVTFEQFGVILKVAQDIHRFNNEPIPSLNENSTARIDSCLNAPFQTVFGRAAYVGFFKKATALFYYIAKGHPLANGNKRLACLTLSFLCFKNGRYLSMSNEQIIDIAHYVADSDPVNKDECMARIEKVLRRTVIAL